MKITSVRIAGYRGAPDGDYSFSGSDGRPHPLVLVRGGARSGKTSFLESIALLRRHLSMQGPLPPAERTLKRGVRRADIAATWQLSEQEASYAGASSSTVAVSLPLGRDVVPALPDPGLKRLFDASDQPAIGKLVYLGADRHWPTREEAFVPSLGDVRSSPFDTTSVPSALCEIAGRDGDRAIRTVREHGVLGAWDTPDSLEPLRRHLVPLLPHLRLDAARQGSHGPDVLFSNVNGEIFSVFDLSSSERAVILVAACFFLLDLRHSIILVDQPELHVAPAERVAWLQALQSFGNHNQLLLASDAPELQAEVPRHQHVVL